MNKKIVKALDILLFVSGIVFFILIFVLDDSSFAIIGFGQWFCAIALLMLKDDLMPLVHYTVGLVAITGSYVYKILPFLKARLSDPNYEIYLKLAVPILFIIGIYVLILIGNNKYEDKYMFIAKIMHLMYLGAIVALIYM